MKTGKSAFLLASMLGVMTLAAPIVQGADEVDAVTGADAGITAPGFDPNAEQFRQAGMGISLSPMLMCLSAKVGQAVQLQFKGAKPACDLEADPKELSCPVSPATLQGIDQIAQSGINSLGACEAQANAAINELNCLSQAASTLNKQLAMFDSLFEAEMTRFQNDMVKIEELEKDRNNQLQQATDLLDGKGSTVGLKKVQADLEALTLQMETELALYDNTNKQIEKMEQSLKEQKQAQVMKVASKCFQTEVSADYVCNPQGRSTPSNPLTAGPESASSAPTSAMNFLLCRVEQNEFVGPTGQVESGGAVEDRATGKKARLQALLNEIFSLTPKTGVPVSADENAASIQESPMILSAAEVDNVFGPKLEEFNSVRIDSNKQKRTFNVRSFVNKAFGGCFTKGTQSVEIDSGRANSTIGIAQAQLDERRRDSVRKFSELQNKYSQAFQKAKTSITRQPTVVRTKDCNVSKPDGRLACLQGFKNATQNFLQADPTENPVGRQQITLESFDKKANVVITCGSLNACIANLESSQTQLQRNVEQLGQFKTRYASTAFNTTQGFIRTVAGPMGLQSAKLQESIASLNQTVLGPLGLDGIKTTSMTGKVLGKDEHGLPSLDGQKASDIIGSAMTPPMIDLSADDPFGTASTAIGAATKGIETRKQGFVAMMADARAKVNECKDAKAAAILERISTSVDLIEASGNCSAMGDACPRDKVSELAASLMAVEPSGSIKSADLMNLSNTLEGICDPEGSAAPGETNADTKYNKSVCKRLSNNTLKGDIEKLDKATSGTGSAGIAQ